MVSPSSPLKTIDKMKHLWITGITLGSLAALPSVAHAHGQYLQQVNDTITADLAAPACALPGMTCGLCHQPLEGDRLENIVVTIRGIDPTNRNGPFYESLTGEGGWDHLPHADDGNVHRDMNLAALTDVLQVVLANGTDSDGDGVPDLEELSLGYNPLLPYDEADPVRSQLCAAAAPFPGVGGSSGSSSGGDESTGGGMASTTAGGEDTGEPSVDSSGGNPPPPPPPSTDDGTTTGAGTGDSGSDTGASNDDGGGCRVAGAGYDPKALGLLLLLGLVARRRW